MRDTIIVLIDTGLRCGELWRLTGRDVDFTHDMVSVWQTKADMPRSVPMTRRVRAIMLKCGGLNDQRFFPHDNN